MKRMNRYMCRESWSLILRRYLPCLALSSLLWELVQLPLYTLWADATPGWIAFSVVHCTAGDVLIGTAALLLALVLNRAGEPGDWPATRVITATIVLTVSYTVLSERLNLSRGSWTYSSWMPVLPWIGVGLAPLAQWVLVPLATFCWSLRNVRNRLE
jgi:hypothetical protein